MHHVDLHGQESKRVLEYAYLNGMRSYVSWRGPAKRYAALYRAIVRPAE
jgi:glycogen synthase